MKSRAALRMLCVAILLFMLLTLGTPVKLWLSLFSVQNADLMLGEKKRPKEERYYSLNAVTSSPAMTSYGATNDDDECSSEEQEAYSQCDRECDDAINDCFDGCFDRYYYVPPMAAACVIGCQIGTNSCYTNCCEATPDCC